MRKLLSYATFGALLATGLAGTAHASTYQVKFFGDPNRIWGCMAVNETDGLAILAEGDILSLLASSPGLVLKKGADVSGSWTVDTENPVSFSGKSPSEDSVSLDISQGDAVTNIVAAGALKITANGKTVRFSLAGIQPAFAGLISCMKTKKSP